MRIFLIVGIIVGIILLIAVAYLNFKVVETDKLIWGSVMPKKYKPGLGKIFKKVGIISISNTEDRIDDLEGRIDDLDTKVVNIENDANDLANRTDDLESELNDIKARTEEIERILHLR